MTCGGFTCSKNALIGLNVMYIVVSFILIAVAAYGQTANLVSNISIVGGIVACGVLLLLISILGLVGAAKHHQVILFFYMVILFLLFLIQFSIACACLAVNDQQQRSLTEVGWRSASTDIKSKVQSYFQCCGYNDVYINMTDGVNQPMGHPSCYGIQQCCPHGNESDSCCYDGPCSCRTCEQPLVDAVHAGLKGSGGIGLFFSFTEFIGVWLTVRYRNQKDPRANPRDFI